MNQRSRNRSRHAAMPCGQLVERRNGRRIAQHHGDLPATGNAGGLALSAGLGFHRSDFAVALGALGQAIFQPLRNLHDLAAVVVRQLLVAFRLGGDVVLGMGKREARGAFGVGVVLGGEGHGWLRVGTTGPSSHVTSDVSTTILRAGL